jgi:hypothetical protein
MKKSRVFWFVPGYMACPSHNDPGFFAPCAKLRTIHIPNSFAHMLNYPWREFCGFHSLPYSFAALG